MFNTKHNTKVATFEIVIARYNEDLKWMTHPVVKSLLKQNEKNTTITIYNKGPNNNHLRNLNSYKNVNHYQLNNLGRDMHTYAHHMSTRYDSLADVTLFLPGSCNMSHKYIIMLQTMYHAYNTSDSVFICADVRGSSHLIRDFEVVSYVSTSKQNRSINSNKKLVPAFIRPFGRWYDHVVGTHIPLEFTTQFGIMAVSRENIHNKPKQFYVDIVKELSVPDPELGFYLEIAWVSIFHPVPRYCIHKTVFLSLLNRTINTLKIKSN